MMLFVTKEKFKCIKFYSRCAWVKSFTLIFLIILSFAQETKGRFIGDSAEIKHNYTIISESYTLHLNKAEIYRLSYLFFLQVAMQYLASENPEYNIENSSLYMRYTAFSNYGVTGRNVFPVSWFHNKLEVPDCDAENSKRAEWVCLIFSEAGKNPEYINRLNVSESLQRLANMSRDELIANLTAQNSPSGLDMVLSAWADEYHAKWVGNLILAKPVTANDDRSSSSAVQTAFALRDLDFFKTNTYQGGDVVSEMVYRIGSIVSENKACGETELSQLGTLLESYQAIGFAFALNFAVQYCSSIALKDKFEPALEQLFRDMLQRRQFTLMQRKTMLQSMFMINRQLAAEYFKNHIQRIDAVDLAQENMLAAILFSALNFIQDNADMRADSRQMLERVLRNNREFESLFLVLQLATLPADDVPNQLIRFEP